MAFISKFRKALYTSAKVLGDFNAVKNGKVLTRVKNRIIGKVTGKVIGKL